MVEKIKEKLEPVRESRRIVALDVLRGVAVLGILIINIRTFAEVQAAFFNPALLGTYEGSDYWVWFLSHIFAEQKFMAIFSMLFGAGIVLMWQRAEEGGRRFLGVHLRRMAWLTLFGLLHAYLFWYGDILFYYGICGLVVVWFRRLPAWGLILLAVLLLSIATAVSIVAGATLPYWPQEQVDQMMNDMWEPPAERLDEEIRAYQGGWLDQMKFRVPASAGMQTGAFLFWGFWRCSGMMLLGMALFKLKIFDASRSRYLYFLFVLAGLVVGIPTVLYGVKWNISNDFSLSSFFIGGLFNYWGGIFIALSWVGGVMLFYKWAHTSSLSRRLESTGRMALTNYLLMTIICTTIFYGHGFGFFGKVNRVEQLVVVVAIWVFLLVVSPIWLRRFHYGPFEWIWRCLSYWKIFPFVRRAETTAGS